MTEYRAYSEAELAQKEIKGIFQTWDRNGDGRIGVDDLRTVLLKLGVPEASVQMIFANAETNKDGWIDYNEFVAWTYGPDAHLKVQAPRTAGSGRAAVAHLRQVSAAAAASATAIEEPAYSSNGQMSIAAAKTPDINSVAEDPVRITLTTAESKAHHSAYSVAQRSKPLRLADKPGPFSLQPVGVAPSEMQHEYEKYCKRLDSSLAKTMGSWQRLGDMLANEGSSPLEWFWLRRADQHSQSGSEPDGLLVYRVVKKSMIIGELLHLSVVDSDHLSDAIDSTLARMFAWLPIKCIRCTLFHLPDATNEKLEPNKAVENVFKGKFFKWFQLSNAAGTRGTVLNRPHAPEPDGPDPQSPPDVPGLVICLGQLWFQGGADQRVKAKRVIDCPLGLTMAAPCLQELWSHSSAAAAAEEKAIAVATAGIAARQKAQQALAQALLSGKFDTCLAKYRPVDLQPVDKDACEHSTALAVRLGKSLQHGSGGVPCARCEGSKDAITLVQKGLGAKGFAEATAGLGTERLSEDVGGMTSRDAAFCRIFITTDWGNCMPSVDGDSFEVPIVSVGSCPSHSEPVFYLPTSEDDIHIVVIPCGNSAPLEHEAFLACTNILRATKPIEPAPFAVVRLESLSARCPYSISEISQASALEVHDDTLQVAEFGTWAMSIGRETPGRLAKPIEAAAYTVKKPYILAVWHQDLETLNVPLACLLVT